MKKNRYLIVTSTICSLAASISLASDYGCPQGSDPLVDRLGRNRSTYIPQTVDDCDCFQDLGSSRSSVSSRPESDYGCLQGLDSLADRLGRNRTTYIPQTIDNYDRLQDLGSLRSSVSSRSEGEPPLFLLANDTPLTSSSLYKSPPAYEAKYLHVRVENHSNWEVTLGDVTGTIHDVPCKGIKIPSGKIAAFVFRQDDRFFRWCGATAFITIVGRKGHFDLCAKQDYCILKAGRITGQYSYHARRTDVEGGCDINGIIESLGSDIEKSDGSCGNLYGQVTFKLVERDKTPPLLPPYSQGVSFSTSLGGGFVA